MRKNNKFKKIIEVIIENNNIWQHLQPLNVEGKIACLFLQKKIFNIISGYIFICYLKNFVNYNYCNLRKKNA